MATRCSTNPPLCLTARYTSIAFQRCSQLSFAVAMIIRALHFRCCAMRIRAIPSLFQRKTALRVSVADQRISLLFHCFAMLCPASRLIAFASLLTADPRYALAFLCATTLYFAIPLPCHAVRGFAAAAHCVTPLSHCVAEIRIAPQSLCCSSGSKTELSLLYAVLDCAALHLSVATPCATSLFLCCAELR